MGRLLAPLGLLIVVASLIAYSIVHKPFKAEELLAVLTVVYRLGVSAAIMLLCGGIGRKIRRTEDLTLTEAAMDAAVGLGIVGVVMLVLGAVIGFDLWILLPVIFIAAFLFRREILSFATAWKEAGTYFKTTGLGIGLIAGFTVFILITNLLIALAPPTSFDGLTYHLALPKYYLIENRIDYVPEIMFWGMPQSTEMVFTLAMKLGGAEAAALLEWMIGVTALAALFSFTRNILNTSSAWIAVASLLCGWTISDSLSRAYVEWSILLYGAVFLAQLDRWRTTRSQTDLVWSAVFAGLALSTKYTGGVLAVAGMAVLFFDLRRSFFKETFFFGLVATIVFSPWLIKNFLATGNPFYPILLPAGAMTATRLDFYEGTPIALPFLERVLLPVFASLFGIEGGAPYNASIGPLLIGLSLPAWIVWKHLDPPKRKTFITTLIILVIGVTFWMIGSIQTRLLIQPRLFLVFFPAWAALAAFGYHGFEHSNLPRLNISWLISMLAAFSLGLNTYETGTSFVRHDALGIVIGQSTANEYLASNLGGYASAMEGIRSLPYGSRVLLLWETRGYYCIPACDPDETIDEFKESLAYHKSSKDIAAGWRGEGYTHILLHNTGAEFVQNNDLLRYVHSDWDVFDELTASLQEVESFGKSYTLYRLP